MTTPVATRRLPLDAPLDLVRTATVSSLGRSDPSIRVERDRHGATVWRALRTPGGAATIALRLEAGPGGNAGAIGVRAWGPGRVWALEQAPALAGQRDDLSGFDPSPHPVVARLHRRRPGFRLGATGRIVDALVPTILGQKVTGHESVTAYRALVRATGGPAPGPAPPALRLPPDPEAVLGLGYPGFHPLGVERRRAETVLRVCRKADAIDRLGDAEPDRVTEVLTAIPGIGPWTEATVRLVALGDPDALPLGDDNFPARVAWALAGERTADDARMLELLAPFTGHRARVLRLITSASDGPPRRGPRRATPGFAHF